MKRLALSLLAAWLVLAMPLAALAGVKDQRLDIYWIDVEGGAATLIVTPQGESVLIDTGNPGQRDAGRIAELATRVASLQRIDHVIITHYHVDHFGGAAMLSRLLPLVALYDNGTFEGQREFPDKQYLALKCEKRIVINPGDRIALRQPGEGQGPALALRCLATRTQFIDAPPEAEANAAICAAHKPKARDGSDNANSVVMLLDFGRFRFYDAGDLTWNQEQRLVCPKNLVGKADVYQVTHHGLDSSNNPIVLRTIEPTIAVMNNGATKGCMPEVFANLKATPSIRAIYQMHKNERPDGRVNNTADELIANQSAENCQGNYIHLSVSPDGESYTVRIPATGHEATYKTLGQER